MAPPRRRRPQQRIAALYVPEKSKQTRMLAGSPAEAAKELVAARAARRSDVVIVAMILVVAEQRDGALNRASWEIIAARSRRSAAPFGWSCLARCRRVPPPTLRRLTSPRSLRSSMRELARYTAEPTRRRWRTRRGGVAVLCRLCPFLSDEGLRAEARGPIRSCARDDCIAVKRAATRSVHAPDVSRQGARGRRRARRGAAFCHRSDRRLPRRRSQKRRAAAPVRNVAPTIDVAAIRPEAGGAVPRSEAGG